MDQSSPTPFRSPELLNCDDSRLLIVDMQERLLSVVPEAAAVVAKCERLARGAQILGVPVSATEQYPARLGSTVEPLRGLVGPAHDKLRFSCAGVLNWSHAAGGSDRPKIVVAGIETHVCILQTALDLIAAGFAVYVVADATASRHEIDAKFALKRLRDGGATVTTTETVLFEWCEAAGSEEFKAISRLVKERDRS
jgi:isochorismate hydrolase